MTDKRFKRGEIWRTAIGSKWEIVCDDNSHYMWPIVAVCREGATGAWEDGSRARHWPGDINRYTEFGRFGTRKAPWDLMTRHEGDLP